MNNNSTPRDPEKGTAAITEQPKMLLFEGPLPDPQTLRSYKEIYPDSVKVIFDLTKDYQNHVINMEILAAKTTKIDVLLSFLLGFTGQIGTLIISMSGFLLAYFRPELGKAGFSFSATVCGYLIWWKTWGRKRKVIDKQDS
jgi:uncharacterized membrane protein